MRIFLEIKKNLKVLKEVLRATVIESCCFSFGSANLRMHFKFIMKASLSKALNL